MTHEFRHPKDYKNLKSDMRKWIEEADQEADKDKKFPEDHRFEKPKPKEIEEVKREKMRASHLKQVWGIQDKPKPKETIGRTIQEATAEISKEWKQERLESEEDGMIANELGIDDEKLIADELGIDLDNMNDTIKESYRNKTCVNCFDALSTMKIKELDNSPKGYVYCEKCDVTFGKFQKEVRKELDKKDFYNKPKKPPTEWGTTRWVLTILIISIMWIMICTRWNF